MRKGKLIGYILSKFEKYPTGAWMTGDLIIEYYGVTQSTIEKKHRVSMLRAMRTVEINYPHLTCTYRGGREGQLAIYDKTNALSCVRVESIGPYGMGFDASLAQHGTIRHVEAAIALAEINGDAPLLKVLRKNQRSIRAANLKAFSKRWGGV